MEDKETKPKKTEEIRDEKGLFLEGTKPGPGRPFETEEDKIKKKALKQAIAEIKEKYENDLAELLPDIPPILKAEIKKGNMVAIKETNDRVLGQSVKRIGNPDGSNLIPSRNEELELIAQEVAKRIKEKNAQ